MAPPKEPTSGWPSTEYDPETVYDTWTWKLPPWLEIAPSADGFIHFPIDQGGPPWPEEQLFLPRNTAMKHLVPPIAFWLDLVNSKPHALTGFALRVLNEATGEVLKVHPGDMWAMLMAEYRDNTWITLIDSNKLNADKCKSCNSAPISVECTTMAWTPPNKDTGEYPRISNTGEEENILSYGCLRCASMGKVCSKLGQQLYPLPQINKKQKKTYDGKPLEPLMLSEVVKLPPGYRILFEEPKRPRLLATPSTRQNTEPPASLASSSSKNEQAAAAGALATAAPPPGTESSRASSLKIKIKRSIGTSDTTEDRRPKVSRSILPTPPATASPASYPTADTRACTSTEIAQYPTLRPISEYDLSTDITHSDLAPGTKSIKIPDRAAQARICYRVQRAREAAPHLWPHNAALLGMFRCMPRAGILAKFDYAPMVYQDGSGAKPEPAFPAFLYTHTDFTCSIASFAGKPTILFDWTYPHPDTLQYPNLVNESIVLDPCLHCSTSYEAKKACKVRNLILWGKDKGKKFEYPESMETEDRRGMAKNRGRMRLHSWTDDMVYCRYYIHDHEVRRLKAPAQTDDAPLNPGSHIMAVDPVSAAGPSSDTTPQHELPDRPNVSATSLSRWARQLSVTPPRSRELQPRTIGPVEPLIVMPAAIGISDEERPSPFLDRRPLPSPFLPAEAANLDTDVDMGDDNDGWSDCRIPPSAHATLSQPDDSRLEVKEEPQEGAEELEWGNVRTIPPRPASTATAGEPYHPLETHASLRHATSTRRPSPSAIDNDIKPNIANPDRDDSEDPDVPLSSTFRRDDASALQEQNATLRAEIARLKAKLAHEREQRQQDQDKYEDKLEKVQDELVRERNHTAQLDSKVKGYKSDWRKERDLRLKDRAGADPGLGQMTTSAPGLPLGRSVSRNEHWAGSSSGAGIVDSTSGINAGEETRTVPLEGSGVGGGRGHAPRMIDLTEDDD